MSLTRVSTVSPSAAAAASSLRSTTGSQVHSAAQCATSTSAGPAVLEELPGPVVPQVGGEVDVRVRPEHGVEQEVPGPAADHDGLDGPVRVAGDPDPVRGAGQGGRDLVGERRAASSGRQPADPAVAAVDRRSPGTAASSRTSYASSS